MITLVCKASALLLVSLFLSSFLISSTGALLSIDKDKEDPEVKLCKQQCWSQQQFDKAQKQQCVQGCDEFGRMKKEIERRTQPGVTQEEPERKLEHCKHECRVSRKSEPEKRRCVCRCEEKYWEEISKPKEEGEELFNYS
jgi:hypothetical protein